MRHSLGSYTGLGLQKLLRPSCNGLVWGPKLRQKGVNPRALGPPATHSHLAAEAPLGMTKFGHQMLLILPVSHASASALPAMVGMCLLGARPQRAQREGRARLWSSKSIPLLYVPNHPGAEPSHPGTSASFSVTQIATVQRRRQEVVYVPRVTQQTPKPDGLVLNPSWVP